VRPFFSRLQTVLIGIATFGLAASVFSLAGPPRAPASSRTQSVHSAALADTSRLRAVERHVFRRTNQVRRERGLSPLRSDRRLAAVACAHNADMFRRDFFEHVNPDGEAPQDRVARMHRRLVGGVSENLYGQSRSRKSPDALAAQMVEKWMDSPPHRKNILSAPSTHLGVCVLRRGRTLRATQLFANVVGYLSPPLPRRVERGTVLGVSFAQTFPPDAVIARHDFWSSRSGRPLSPPLLFTDSLHVPDTVGAMRPRFYTLGAGEYVVHKGPRIEVVDDTTVR
jgi:uncharacterized protein YkwD